MRSERGGAAAVGRDPLVRGGHRIRVGGADEGAGGDEETVRPRTSHATGSFLSFTQMGSKPQTRAHSP